MLSKIAARLKLSPSTRYRLFQIDRLRKGIASGAASPTADHRVPTSLVVNRKPPRRVLLLGSCLAESWHKFIETDPTGCVCDWVGINNMATLPKSPPRSPEEYDFQVVQLPLRAMMAEAMYARLEFSEEAHQELFDWLCLAISHMLREWLLWHTEYGLLTFITNFMVPQQNPLGRMLPRADMCNLMYMIEQLNYFLAKEVAKLNGAFILDIDQIAATVGRRYIQDDVVLSIAHASQLADYGWSADTNRIEPPKKAITATFASREEDFVRAIWAEVVAMYRSANQVDQVKLVVVDLDDTLWRGCVGDTASLNQYTNGGWPLGMIDALAFLKKRGILLAIISKNDKEVVENEWLHRTGGALLLEDFVSVKINWQPKHLNFAEILQETNVLPCHSVFIDDNPRERDLVQREFPEARVLGDDLYLLRSTLLWSSETQLSTITVESAKRTQLIAQAIEREKSRNTNTSHSNFLHSLKLKVSIGIVRECNPEVTERCLELLNKTNQFNTTGERWSSTQMRNACQNRFKLYYFEVEDRFSHYGIVGVAVADGSLIRQLVMSCRVIGLDIEKAVISFVVTTLLRAGHSRVEGRFVRTERNHLCSDLFERCGFHQDGSSWVIESLSCFTCTAEHIECIEALK